MLNLSQRDPRWGAKKLGASNLTLAGKGCTTTCISMLSDYFKCYLSPDQIAKNKDWYTPDGLVKWTSMKFRSMKFVWRQKGFVKSKVDDSLKDPNKGVILQVNNGAHWILAKRKTIFGNDYVCLDPWTGKDCLAIKDYHNITGSAHYERIK